MKAMVYPIVIICALLFTRYNNSVLLFHTLAELFSIFVGLLMLVVVLNTQHFVRNDFLIFLGIGYFSISVLDALHAFTIAGMPFFNITDGEITIHLWIYSRLFEALLLLFAPVYLTNRLNTKVMIIMTSVLLGVIAFVAFHFEQPIMFVDGKLSNFKVYTEFVVILLLASAIGLYWKKRLMFEQNVLFFLISSLVLTILAELCFTLYSSFNGLAFVIGHIFKFLSFWMIYQAIIQTTLNEPLKLLTISSNSYDAIPNPAIRVDENGFIAQVNRAALLLVGNPIEQLIHQPIHRNFHPELVEESLCPFCIAIKSGQSILDQEVYLSNAKQWYLLSITPVDPLNKKGGVVQSLTNISHQKHQEKELIDNKNLLEIRVKERTAELELSFKELAKTQSELVESKKMASLGSLVAGISHEINTPVGVCITAASNLCELTHVLKTNFENEEVTKSNFVKYIDNAEQNANIIVGNLSRAAELIGSFKQVAVDQSSELFRTFYLKAYITTVIESLSPKFNRRNIKINFSTDDDFEVHTSPSAISQVLTNLFMNSLIHGFDIIDFGDIYIKLTKINEAVVFTYQDSGKGISTEDLPKIYDPFFTTKLGQGGSGLGLNIVYNLVSQSLKGTIICTSEEDRGALFTIEFPCNN
jgi:signal transduction histidine kinase